MTDSRAFHFPRCTLGTYRSNKQRRVGVSWKGHAELAMQKAGVEEIEMLIEAFGEMPQYMGRREERWL